MPYLISIDQGTSSSRVMLFDELGKLHHTQQTPVKQYYPKEAWVEHDAWQIWQDVRASLLAVLEKKDKDIVAIGISNQRETTIVWDKTTGKPLAPAIVWQDRRTTSACKAIMEDASWVKTVQQKTGLLIDPYFSATKIQWLIENVPTIKEKMKQGQCCIGTMDTFLLWHLTGGQQYKTDITNASRTMLFNIHEKKWDAELCDFFGVPMDLLPEVCPNTHDFGVTDAHVFKRNVPIRAMAGDQQAAAIGQACFQKGMAKSTYGTGCFMLLNTGDEALVSNCRLLTTVLYEINGQLAYGLEGSIFSAGSAIGWMQDGLGLIEKAADSMAMSQSVADTNGVYMVPAFTGLGAPYWDAKARGGLLGITRDTNRAHVVRAALESVAYQTLDLLKAMQQDGADALIELRIDGGMAANSWFNQFLSDMLQLPTQKPACIETSALGVAYLAGLGAGIYKNIEQVAALWRAEKDYKPRMSVEAANQYYAGWQQAVARVRSDF